MKADELTRLAIDWLCHSYPDAIIVRELSVADWGGASLDVGAITPNEIVGVEVKGEGDSPARLPLQGLAYGMVARKMWLLPDQSIYQKCRAKKPTGWGLLEIWDGKCRPMNTATKLGEKVKTKTGYHFPAVRDDTRYMPSEARALNGLCPAKLCGTLWRDELARISAKYALLCHKATVEPLRDAIISQLPVSVIHDEMIAALRARTWKKAVIDLRRSAL